MELLATGALRFNKARTVYNIHQLLRAGAIYICVGVRISRALYDNEFIWRQLLFMIFLGLMFGL